MDQRPIRVTDSKCRVRLHDELSIIDPDLHLSTVFALKTSFDLLYVSIKVLDHELHTVTRNLVRDSLHCAETKVLKIDVVSLPIDGVEINVDVFEVQTSVLLDQQIKDLDVRSQHRKALNVIRVSTRQFIAFGYDLVVMKVYVSARVFL